MVDLAKVPNVSVLVDEFNAIGRALNNFDNGGRIVAMQVSAPAPQTRDQEGGPPPLMAFGVTVPTTTIDYPPQMVTTIKNSLESRRNEIAQELQDIGVTGIDVQARAKKGK